MGGEGITEEKRQGSFKNLPAEERMDSEHSRTLRCPFCHEVAEWRTNLCPHCGKPARKPDFFAKKQKKSNQRREERERRRQELWANVNSVGIWGAFVAKSPVMRWCFLLGIIFVLGSMLLYPMREKDESGAIKLTRYNLSMLRVALERFHADCGRFPTVEEGLKALVENPVVDGWRGPYIHKLKLDSWKRGFIYEDEGSWVSITSTGPDRKRGTADDLVEEVDSEPEPPDLENTSVFIEKSMSVAH